MCLISTAFILMCNSHEYRARLYYNPVYTVCVREPIVAKYTFFFFFSRPYGFNNNITFYGEKLPRRRRRMPISYPFGCCVIVLNFRKNRRAPRKPPRYDTEKEQTKHYQRRELTDCCRFYFTVVRVETINYNCLPVEIAREASIHNVYGKKKKKISYLNPLLTD